MTGGDGNVSSPAPLHAGTPINGISAVPGSASGSDVGRSMKRDKELALAGGSSAATMGSPPPQSKSLKGREAEVEDGKEKRKKAVFDASGMPWSCNLCDKSFKSQKAVHGHKRVHGRKSVHKTPKEASTLGQRKSNKTATRGTKGHGSTMAEGGASSSVAEAQRKRTHMKFDLNKAPEDAENDDEEGA